MTKFQFFILIFLFLSNCQTVSNKIDEKSSQEEKELTKWLNKSYYKKLYFKKQNIDSFTLSNKKLLKRISIKINKKQLKNFCKKLKI